ncbi:NFX1-type zinc finger-containing protein 1 [Durusdinium trenchii]|uniref:NFX1-type zinc finger-containing protein 1 n=1 Tax=Durusdinium trenchii TaxID=1381693 RepID=A0ABP0IC42_9DINO
MVTVTVLSQRPTGHCSLALLLEKQARTTCGSIFFHRCSASSHIARRCSTHYGTLGKPKYHMALLRMLVSSEVAAHPDTLAAQATLKDIAAERNCSNAPPWALEDRAELRSDLVGNFPRVVEMAREPPEVLVLADLAMSQWMSSNLLGRELEASRRESVAESWKTLSSFPDNIAGSSYSSVRVQDRGLAEGYRTGQKTLDVVEFQDGLYIADRKLGQALHAVQLEQKERFCVKIRVIPLCPHTAKVVLANSSQNNGDSVKIRGTLQDGDEWPLDRIVLLLLELALAVCDSPRASQIFGILASGRLLGERSALITSIRSKKRLSQKILQKSWPFLQQLMNLAPSKFDTALPICRYLCKASQGSTPAEAISPFAGLRLRQLLSLVSAASSRLSTGAPQDVCWNCMPLVPSALELKSLKILPNGRAQRSALQRLPVVRQIGSYKSAGEYFDTYFRLLREDCISAIRHSIAYVREHGLGRNGPKQEREADDNVFRATLKGFTVGKGDGADSRIKVCDQDFSDPIWLLAARRDLKHSEVALEFYDGDGGGHRSGSGGQLTSALARLASARQLTLIASPTYFRSFEPVLQSLKTWETVGLPFEKELVECQHVERCSMLSDQRVQRGLIFEDKPLIEEEACQVSSEDLDDDSMLIDLPHRLAKTKSSATKTLPMMYQVVGISADAIGLSWPLMENVQTEVEVEGEVLFEVTWKGPSEGIWHQIQVVNPYRETSMETEQDSPGGLEKLGLGMWSGWSFGWLRFRISALAGTVEHLRREISNALENPSGPLAKATTWDPSQLQAAEHALKCRVALIQGPPGTGKTFIGCKLLQMFLPNSRVLVLTYKNHALDDFLQHCLQAGYVDTVARVGGRSNDDSQELQSCNLRSLRKKLQSRTGKRKNDADVDQAIHKLMALASQAKFVVAAEQHKLLVALHHFLDRGRECADIVGHSLDQRWEQLPELLGDSSEQEEQVIWACYWLRDYLDRALMDWYPPGKHVAEVARAYFGQDCEQDPDEEAPARVVSADEAVVVIDSQEDLKKVSAALQQNLQVLHAVQLHDGVLIEKGWTLHRCVDRTGAEVLCAPQLWRDQAALAQRPLSLFFEPDDEAERELQAEIEAERLQGAGTDARESLSEAERKALIPARREGERDRHEGRPHVRVPYKVSGQGDCVERWPNGALFHLNKEERAKVVVQQIAQQAQSRFQQLEEAVQGLATACAEEEANDMNFSSKILETKKIIGMTITGASINIGLLKQVKPDVVIVEEAAEVLEPQILAVLGPWVKNLILIGDHRQLPPPVETYTLKQNHLFDTSMLERLIHNKLPNVELSRQGRMLPSLCRLLSPIYPFLGNNEKVVKKLRAPECVESEVFFWNCPHEEEKAERSHVNNHECERAVRLTFFFISQGYQPSKITVLAAYQAQTFLINREIKKQLPEYLRGIGFKRELVSFKAELDPSLIKRGNVVDITDTVLEQGRVLGAGGQKVKTGRYILKSPVPDGQNEKIEVQLEPSNLQPDETPEVSTIDRYQGAENEIVIVSLVRSNAEKKLGFLGTEDGRNRMCVAQSRARCGLYFIGNVECLRSANHWRELLDMLQERGCVGDQFPQRCPRHPHIQNFATEANEVGFVCKQLCGKAFGCGIADHVCKRQCHPDEGSHHADKCVYTVQKTYQCHESPAHVFETPCRIETESQPCPFIEKLRCKRGCHTLKRMCGQNTESLVNGCTNRCPTQLACGHECPNRCSQVCVQDGDCQILKRFDCPVCPDHKKIWSECNSSAQQVAAKCKSKCSKLLACKHHCNELCSEECTTRCEKRCKKLLECGHLCPNKCLEECGKVSDCKVLKLFDCPAFPRLHRRIQSACNSNQAELAMQCESRCSRQLDCGHPCGEKCCDPCTKQCEMPCPKKLACGHLCPQKCSEECGKVSDCRVLKLFDCPAFPQSHRKIQSACNSSQAELAMQCESRCSRPLDCGHPCGEKCCDPCTKQCQMPCAKKLECGHPCPQKCWESCPSASCRALCGRPCGSCGHACEERCCDPCKCLQPCIRDLDCGHVCGMKCHEACKCMMPKKVLCQRTTGRPHEVQGLCGERDEDIASRCQEACGEMLPCGHTCKKTCSACMPHQPAECNEPCGRDLPCGHPCDRPCGECETTCGACLRCTKPPAPKAMPKPATKRMPRPAAEAPRPEPQPEVPRAAPRPELPRRRVVDDREEAGPAPRRRDDRRGHERRRASPHREERARKPWRGRDRGRRG